MHIYFFNCQAWGSQIADYSHQENAWKLPEFNKLISYEYAFDIELGKKNA